MKKDSLKISKLRTSGGGGGVRDLGHLRTRGGGGVLKWPNFEDVLYVWTQIQPKYKTLLKLYNCNQFLTKRSRATVRIFKNIDKQTLHPHTNIDI